MFAMAPSSRAAIIHPTWVLVRPNCVPYTGPMVMMELWVSPAAVAPTRAIGAVRYTATMLAFCRCRTLGGLVRVRESGTREIERSTEVRMNRPNPPGWSTPIRSCPRVPPPMLITM